MACDARSRSKGESFWRRMVEGQKDSGRSIRAWCGEHHLRESAFYWWRRRLARRETESPAAAFVPVRVTAGLGSDAHNTSRIEIVLPHERRVCVVGPVDRQMLADVLAVLTSTGSRTSEGAAC